MDRGRCLEPSGRRHHDAGATSDERFEAAQKKLGKEGGVVYFPAGEYFLHEHLKLAGGVVIRGADPTGETEARNAKYSLGTRLEFPRYVPEFRRQRYIQRDVFQRHPISRAGCSKQLRRGQRLDQSGAHPFWRRHQHRAGQNRIVFGCILQNAALIDEHVPDAKLGQHAWQRYTKWHQAAIHVYTGENALAPNGFLGNWH